MKSTYLLDIFISVYYKTLFQNNFFFRQKLICFSSSPVWTSQTKPRKQNTGESSECSLSSSPTSKVSFVDASHSVLSFSSYLWQSGQICLTCTTVLAVRTQKPLLACCAQTILVLGAQCNMAAFGEVMEKVQIFILCNLEICRTPLER